MNALQFHFHTPSEHTIDGKHYDMEWHFVTNYSTSGKGASSPLAVVGVLFQVSRPPALPSAGSHWMSGLSVYFRVRRSLLFAAPVPCSLNSLCTLWQFTSSSLCPTLLLLLFGLYRSARPPALCWRS